MFTSVRDRPAVRPPPRFPGGPAGLALAVLAAGLELFLGVGGLFGGVQLVRDPSGGLLQLPFQYIERTPFPDYLAPGVILLLANGVLPMVALAAILVRPRIAPPLVTASGAVLIGWMIGQIGLIGYEFWLQGVLLAVGAAILGVGASWWAIARR